MKEAGFGAKFITSISGKMVSLVGFGFVDDVDLIQTSDVEENLIEMAEKGLELWEGCLRAIGGALSAEKYFWYGIAFVYIMHT